MSINPRRYTGTVVNFGDRGFGFIDYETEDNTSLIFAHVNQFRHVPGFERFVPFPGLEVSFVIANTRKGPMALDIEVIGGLEVAGADHE